MSMKGRSRGLTPQPFKGEGSPMSMRDERSPALAAASPTTLAHGIGLQQPRHWFHVGCVVHAAAELKLFLPQRSLLLGNDLTGASELLGLPGTVAFASGLGAADAQDSGAGAHDPIVQAQRRIAQAQQSLRASQRLIVELPGVRDAQGRSPFWEGLGRHFCPTTPDEAAARHGSSWQGHVAALLPRQLIYASFLPEPAQQAIGQAAPEAQPLWTLLHAAGFAWHGHISIADAGPVLEWVAPAGP
jgi:arginine N-succinyltransferase